MRVLQLGKAFPPVNLGGVEVVIKLLTEGLNERGIYCDSLGVNDRYQFKIEKGLFGGMVFRTRRITKMFSTLISVQLITILYKIKERYDVIHVHSPDPMAALAYYLCKPSSKLVLHWHSDILRQKLIFIVYRPLLEWLLRRADVVLATSPNYIDGSAFLSRYREKVKVLPIGLDVDQHIDEAIYSSLQAEYSGKKIVFSLGRLAYYKGFQYLVNAASSLPKDYVVLIAGSGEQKDKLLQLIQYHGLSEKVKLLGKIDDLTKNVLFKICDVFALSSIYKTEAFAIVQVEAMAWGRPIVSTIIEGSGVSWVNKNLFSGITVPVRDSDGLSKAITAIAENKELHSLFSKNAFERYNEYFTHEKMISDLAQIYNLLILRERRIG